MKFTTDNTDPPFCAVLSERGMQFVCFSYTTTGEEETVDCLVFPEVPLFVNSTMDVMDTSMIVVNVNRCLCWP